MVFKDLCYLVHWTKVASALEGLKIGIASESRISLKPSMELCIHECNISWGVVSLVLINIFPSENALFTKILPNTHDFFGSSRLEIG